MENGKWFPFKGTREKGEDNNQTAVREIYEETCCTVKLDKINLQCNFSTKRKHYHIGLIEVSPDIINKFYKNYAILSNENRYHGAFYKFLEKNHIKMFPIADILNKNFHEVTMIPIRHYYPYLKLLEEKNNGAVTKQSPLKTYTPICKTIKKSPRKSPYSTARMPVYKSPKKHSISLSVTYDSLELQPLRI